MYCMVRKACSRSLKRFLVSWYVLTTWVGVVFYSVIGYGEITESQSLAKSYMLTPFPPYGEEGVVMVFANSE